MYDLPFAGPLFDTVTADRILATAQRPAVVLSEIARTLKNGGRAVVIEDFDALSAAGAANPIATLREWFARAGLECARLRPVDTENAHLLVALARRPIVDTRQSA
jgi:ubiquinone/menaquinone biosynthesis C-methylase UbiE